MSIDRTQESSDNPEGGFGRRGRDVADESDRCLVTRWGWLLALGIVQLLAGVAAIAVPPVATVVATLFFGWLLAIAAVFHIVHAFQVRRWQGFALHLLGGLLYGAASVLIFMYPWTGAISLTLVLAALLLVEGALRSVLALRLRPHIGWGWLLVGGLMSLVLGALLLAGWPSTGLWAIGLLVGIQLVFSGATYVALALSCRRRRDEVAGHPVPAH